MAFNTQDLISKYKGLLSGAGNVLSGLGKAGIAGPVGQFVANRPSKVISPLPPTAPLYSKKIGPIDFQIKNTPTTRLLSSSAQMLEPVRKFGQTVGEGLSNVMLQPQIQQNRQNTLNQSNQTLLRARDLINQGKKNEAKKLLQVNLNMNKRMSDEAVKQSQEAQKGVKNTAVGGIRTGLTTLGLMATPVKSLLPSLGVGGAIGGGISKVMGEDVASGIGQGIALTPEAMGLGKFTAPIISGTLSRVPQARQFIVNQIASRALAGGMNVAEGKVLDNLAERDRTAFNDVLEFSLGAILNGKANEDAFGKAKQIYDLKMPDSIKQMVGNTIKKVEDLYKIWNLPIGVTNWSKGQREYIPYWKYWLLGQPNSIDDKMMETLPSTIKVGKAPSTGGEIKVYHGGGELNQGKGQGKGFSVSTDKKIAGTFSNDGKTSQELLLSKDANILDWKDVPSEIKNSKWSISEKELSIIKYAQSKGYDGVNLDKLYGEKEIRIFNPKVLSSSGGEITPLGLKGKGAEGILKNGESQGVIQAKKVGDTVRIDLITIKDKTRGQGIGKETIESIFRDNPEVKTITGNSFGESKGFWEKLGATVDKDGNFILPRSGGEIGKVSTPKESYKAQVKAAVEKISKPELEKQLQSVSPIQAETKQVVSSAPIISNKGKLNINRLNVEDSTVLKDIESKVKPTIIGNKEVIDMARTAKGTGTLTDDQMKKMLANQLKNRQQVVDLTARFNKAKAEGASEVELGKIMIQLADQSTTARQGGTFAGRLLQAQNIIADNSATPMQKILALLDNAGVSKEKYLKDSIKVDWNDPVEVVTFYRKYVPPKFGEMLTEFRYSNMLSSPLTHIVNITSNAVQTGVVAPVEKTITGVLDWGKSKLTGSERKYYASAGIDYAGGYVKALPQAFKKAMRVLSGKEISIRPDYEHIPSGTKGAFKTFTTPLRALEAMDQFYKTLVEGGVTAELKKGPIKVTPTQITSQAIKEGNYRLFRQAFDPNGELGQGIVLKTFDKWNVAINHLRKLPGGNWILPFMQTPTNILKQGIEFSPLGVTTMLGAKSPTEQLSKAIIGTGVFMGAYQLAKNGLVSWEAPSGEKERELYYAAGQQPYSVKIGDKWVSFSKLGPLSYPFAMASALRNAEKYNPDKSKVENISKSITGMLGFFGDQSYVRSIGDFIDAVQGGVNIGPTALTSQGANFLGQLIPYKSFLTWLGRTIDPVYRKASTFGEKLVKDLPVLGSQLQPYTDGAGQPSKRDLPVLNAVSPYKVTQEKSTKLLDEYQTKKIQKAVEKRADESFLSGNKEAQTSGDVYRYIDDNGTVKKIDMNWTAPTLKLSGNTELDKKIISKYKGELTTRANEIVKLYEEGQLTSEKAEKMLQELKTKSSVSTGAKKGKKPSFKIAKVKFPKIKLAKVKKISIKKSKSLKKYVLKVPKIKKSTIKTTARLT